LTQDATAMADNPYASTGTAPPQPSADRTPNRRFGRLYAIGAILFVAGFFWSRHAAQAAVEEAIR
jgi:hypothetical protein